MNLVESMLVSISEIIGYVTRIEKESEKFIEIGSYFYRVSLAIMELQTTDLINLHKILESLDESVNHAKDHLEKFLTGIHQVMDSEPISTIDLLKDVIKQMGECLSKLPTSTFGDQNYAKRAVRSLSDEMQNLSSKIVQAPALTNKQEMQTSLEEEEQPEKEPVVIEKDLYPINIDCYTEYTESLITSQLSESATNTTQRSQRKYRNVSASLTKLSTVAHYMEPLFDTFFCPLTKVIMDDPVTLETGVTYERRAIIEWFEEFEKSEEIVCPVTGQKLVSKTLNSNRALKSTIDEWKDRNEIARIKVNRAALSLASSDEMVLEAIDDLLNICKGEQRNVDKICNSDMLPLLTTFLEYSHKDVRYSVLELLQQLAAINDDNKKMICRQLDMTTVINLLSSSHQPIRDASLLLLLELSRSQPLSDQIGTVTGGIWMLITIKYNQSDEFASGKADEILRNLESSPTNVKRMAENGLMEPLLRYLNEGSELTRIEMASYLGETVLEHDCKMQVAERAAPALFKMVHEGNALTRRAAFKALAQISSHKPNGTILAKAGAVQVMVEEIFTPTIYDELNDPKTEAAAILANICESDLEFGTLEVIIHGRNMSSDYVICNIIDLLKTSTPDELSISLIRILLFFTKYPKPMATIVSGVKDTVAGDTLIQSINSPHDELGVPAIKLLISLSPYIGNEIAERLCKARGQLENLIRSSTWTNQITEKQALSATFLAKLPHQSLTLNIALVTKNGVPRILQAINQLQTSGTRTSRYASALLEGLVGILVRFTTTLNEPEMLFVAQSHNFTSLFTSLLTQTSSDEVQKLSAIGLEHLSSTSMTLSKPPDTKKNKAMKFLYLPKFLSLGSSKRRHLRACPVHRGTCSSQNTFCLVNARAIERLLTCLDHENEEVVEAALSAICTLLDDKVDVDKSVSLLSEFDAARHVLNVVRMHKQESLWHKSMWLIEKLLMKGGDKSASDISEDRMLPAMLITVFHRGDRRTRETAEKILRLLNMMPNFSVPNHSL